MKVMVWCGGASGGLYAGALAHELRALEPGVTIFGFGGGQLAAAGAELLGDYRGPTVTGLAGVLVPLPRTYALYRHLVAEARAPRPGGFVAIAFPPLNFPPGPALPQGGLPAGD